MASNLVIVESPAKAKTISKFLGSNYIVRASMGHVRDLPKSKTGIDVNNNYEPEYLVTPEKKKVITELKGYLKKDTNLWLATDEDREGEAIGWHLLRALNIDEKKTPVQRIVFHEITEGAIKDALKHPRSVDYDLVDAQQARRVLDRLVGYELSPLLWKKVRFGLSAGRVQSVAVRLVVDREREIRAFKPEEYWSLDAKFAKGKDVFAAALSKFQGKEIKIGSKEQADQVLADVTNANYIVTKVEEKDVKRNPAAPFTTSTLQQEASRKLGFAVKKTMTIAQQLYEGIAHGKGVTGLITYMRTDSVNLSDVALKQAKEVISKEFGPEYALETPRHFKAKKGAQEAHEAIRPVDLSVKPDELTAYLDKDQLRLYELVWKRTIACQMKEAKLRAVGVDIVPFKNGVNTEYTFRATGQSVEFPGFMRVYVEGNDNEEKEVDGEKLLPLMAKDDVLDLKELNPNQHFTKPPARYTEASLVKKLESEGIGRPSTYAPTITTITTRGYIEKDKQQLKPTDLAEVVTDMLVAHFPSIVDYKFTAEMEEKLDEVAEGKKKWVPIIDEFYKPFHANIMEKTNTLKKSDIVNIDSSEEICDKCGSAMLVKLGRFGKFLSCSNYPECKNAKPLSEAADGAALALQPREKTPEELELEAKLNGQPCDKCGKPMEVKRGRYGSFLGCTGYPDCKNMKSIVKSTGVVCPACKEGQLVERRSRKTGKVFFGCNKFPKCNFASWDRPTGELCPTCKTGLMVEKKDGIVCMECTKPVAKAGSAKGGAKSAAKGVVDGEAKTKKSAAKADDKKVVKEKKSTASKKSTVAKKVSTKKSSKEE